MTAYNSYPESWTSHRFRAMGSDIILWLETTDAAAASAFAQARTLFTVNEQALSRFRPESELSQLNALSGQWVAVSDLLWDVLTLALKMAAITNGRFDPTTLRALEHVGYTVSFEQLAGEGLPFHAPGSTRFPGKWTAVALDEARQAVCLPQGVGVDLGGIAKGYTAQKAVELLDRFGACLVDAGGDLTAGRAPPGYPGWPVAISSPWMGNDLEPVDLFTAWLANRSLATSGVDYRNWHSNGRVVHHLIDPATGQPAITDGLTTTVLAEDAVTAETWATAALVLGSNQGMDALSDVGLAGLMVLEDGQILVTPAMHQHILTGTFIDNKGNN